MRERHREPTVVVVVEDDPDDRELLAAALDATGADCTVRFAGDATEVPSVLAAEGPVSLVLIDINLPGHENGIELVARLRAGDGSCPPLVMFTSSDAPWDVRAAYDAGCNAYHVKPFDWDEIVETMRRLVGYWSTVQPVPPAERGATGSSGNL